MAEANPAIRLLESEVNAGPSKARTRGFDAATGDAVAILDGDDAWRPKRLEHMGRLMAETGAEFVADNIVLYDVWADREGRMAYLTDKELTRIDAVTFFENCVFEGFQFNGLKPLMKLEFLRNHDIRYREDVRYGEDLLFYGEMFMAGARGLLMKDGWYVYTTRVGEFSGQSNPHTRSTPDFGGMANGLRSFLARGDARTRKAIQRCITSFESTEKRNQARSLRRQGKYLAYARAIADRDVLTQMAKLRLRLLKVKRATRA